MFKFSESAVSTAETQITSYCIGMPKPDGYRFKRVDKSKVRILNRGLAWSISLSSDGSDAKRRLDEEIRAYNCYLDMLDEIDGFKDFFVEHGCMVSYEDVKAKWSSSIAERVFSKKTSVFSTDLRIVNNTLMDSTISVPYYVVLEDETVLLPIGKDAEAYPTKLGKRHLIWNWVSSGHDFCFSLWELLGEPSNPENEDNENAVVYAFDAYDQIRFEPAEPQLVRIFNKLENLGYIKTYSISSADDSIRWKFFGKSDGSIDCAVVDTSFLENKLVMEQIALLLWTPSDKIKASPYFITDRDNRQRLSQEPGALGGHQKLKIYGRLDCPSAARYLKKGQYAQHRVFFKDEEAAKEAGYRPCGVCMREAYIKWKDNKG